MGHYSIRQRRDIAENTSSASCRDQAQSWLSTYSRHHRKCDRSANQTYPTRLLDLQPHRTDAELCLCITKDGQPHEPYMTLSRCWGAAQFLKLTTATIERFKVGIETSDSLKTFREAVLITKDFRARKKALRRNAPRPFTSNQRTRFSP